MKVVHIINGLEDGGAEAALSRLLSSPSENVTSVVISLTDKGKYGDIIQKLGIEVYCLGFTSSIIDVKNFFKLISLIKNLAPDVVQTWMYHSNLIGGLASRLAGVPKVYWGIHHSSTEKAVNTRSTNWAIMAGKYASMFIPNAIIYCAEEAFKTHTYYGYKSSSHIIPNGYDLSVFNPQMIDKTLYIDDLDSASFRVGYIARWQKIKDHENLLASIEVLKRKKINIRCFLVGTDCDIKNTELISLIGKYKLEGNIILLGKRVDIPQLMNYFHVHVLSSRGEAFPNVIPEAMACGTPCISTDVGDVKSIIGHTGWVVPVKSPVRLADAIEDAFLEFQEKNTWCIRQQQCVSRIKEKYTIDVMSKKYDNVWNDL